LSNFSVDARGIPVILPVADQRETVHRFRHARRNLRRRFRRRRIMQALHPMPEVGTPRRTLMGKDVRLVEMEVVNDIGIKQWLEKNEFIIIRPTCPGRDDRVLWRALTRGSDQLRLHSVPAIAVGKLGLVQDLQEYALLVPGRIVPGQRAPEIGELVHQSVFFSQPRLEVTLRMHINHHSEPLIQNHLHRGVEVAKIFGGDLIGPTLGEHGLRIDAQAHVIKAHRFDQGNVAGGAPVLKMLFGVTAFVVNLSKPLARIDAAAKVSEARGGDRR